MITILKVPIIHQYGDVGLEYDNSNLPARLQDAVIARYMAEVRTWCNGFTIDKIFVDACRDDIPPEIIYRAMASAYRDGSVVASTILDINEMGARLVPTEGREALALYKQAVEAGDQVEQSRALVYRDAMIQYNMERSVRDKEVAILFIGEAHTRVTHGMDPSKYLVVIPPFAQKFLDEWHELEKRNSRSDFS
jgi:hypothetical protein